MRRPRVALVGVGWVAEHAYLPHLGSEGPLELAAVYDIDAARADRAAQRVRLRGGARTLNEALAGVDGVILCVPPASHVRLLCELLGVGLFVLCEKPVLRSSEEVETLRAMGLGARLMGSATTRLRADVETLLDWISAGQIGTLERVTLRWSRGRGVPAPGSWRTDPGELPGGVLDDLAPHLLDLATVLVPEGDDASGALSAELRCRHGTADHAASWFEGGTAHAYAVADVASARLTLANGLSLELDVSWVDGEDGDCCRIECQGTRGTARLDGLFGFSTHRRSAEQVCRLARLDGVEETVLFPPGPGEQLAAFGRSLACFAAFCRGTAPAIADLEAVARVAGWLGAIRRAGLRQGKDAT